MIKALLELAAAELGIAADEIDAWYAAMKEKIAENPGAQDQPIWQRQINNPMRSSTPIDQQISNAEQRHWKIWEDALPQLKSAVAILFALAQQKERLNVLYTARTRQREQTLTDAGMKPGYIKLCDNFQRNGATHSKAAQLKEDEMAIFSDLTRWKEDDPLYLKPDNPWPAIRAIYAERTLRKVGRDGRVAAPSWPGRPPAPRYTPGGVDYWRYGNEQPVSGMEDQDVPPASGTTDTDPYIQVVEENRPTKTVIEVLAERMQAAGGAAAATATPPDAVVAAQLPATPPAGASSNGDAGSRSEAATDPARFGARRDSEDGRRGGFGDLLRPPHDRLDKR